MLSATRAAAPCARIGATRRFAALSVPVIDFSRFRKGDSASRKEVGDELVEAFKGIGFVALVQPGTTPGLTERTMDMSRRFFKLDSKVKRDFAYQSPESNRGWISFGQESLDATTPDLKETFDIGPEGDKLFENRWPDRHLPEFRPTMLQYFREFDQLHLDMMRAIALGLGYDAEFFTPMCNGNHQNLRLLHYPECERSLLTGKQARGGKHTDYGTLTLLAQDGVSGLRAQMINGTWVPITPVKGAIVVNVGEMLMRVTNNALRANPHEVVDIEGDHSSTKVPERLSVAFFSNFNRETVLNCLPGYSSPTNPFQYEPVQAHAYITGRLAGTIEHTTPMNV